MRFFRDFIRDSLINFSRAFCRVLSRDFFKHISGVSTRVPPTCILEFLHWYHSSRVPAGNSSWQICQFYVKDSFRIFFYSWTRKNFLPELYCGFLSNTDFYLDCFSDILLHSIKISSRNSFRNSCTILPGFSPELLSGTCPGFIQKFVSEFLHQYLPEFQHLFFQGFFKRLLVFL